MIIRPLIRQDGRQVAQLHIQGQPGTFLTNLGEDFLTVLYDEIIGSPWALGVAAFEGDLMVGVAVITTSTRRLFDYIKFKRCWRLFWPLLKRLVSKPGLLFNVMQTIRYPQKMSSSIKVGERDTDNRQAEYLFLGVREDFRRQHVAFQVVEASVEECRRKGVMQLFALVDSENNRLKTGAGKYGSRYSWQPLRTIEIYGRTMDVVLLDLSSYPQFLEAEKEQEQPT